MNGITFMRRYWLQANLTTTLLPIVSAVAIVAGFQLMNPVFLSYQGIITLVYAMSFFLIAACGLTFVIMMGSFDFAVVSLMKLSALLSVLYIDVMGLWVIPFALVVSVSFGFLSGVLVAKFNVPSFVATLGVSVLVEGTALYLSKGFLHIMDNDTFRALATHFVGGLPLIFYWGMAIWAVSTFIAIWTPFGRRIYAIGVNAIGAGLSGIDVARQRIYVFMLSSLFAGVAGVLYMAQLGGGSMELGADTAIPLFASVVAGGTALTGGVGGPHRTLLGVLIITWIQAGMLMLAIGRDIQMVTFGLIALVFAAATIDRRIKIIR